MTPDGDWTFDVFTARHDDLMVGNTQRVRSRVIISRSEWPSQAMATDLAGVLACVIHGGMPTAVLIRF